MKGSSRGPARSALRFLPGKPHPEVVPAGACLLFKVTDRGRSSMVERQLPKLHTRVRFPSPAPAFAREACEGCRAEAPWRRRSDCRELRLGKPVTFAREARRLSRRSSLPKADRLPRATARQAGDLRSRSVRSLPLRSHLAKVDRLLRASARASSILSNS
jgi:hypothetical protein